MGIWRNKKISFLEGCLCLQELYQGTGINCEENGADDAMTRIILIQDDDYERQYRESRAYIDDKYFNQPTCLKNIPASDAWWPGMGEIAPGNKSRIERYNLIRPR